MKSVFFVTDDDSVAGIIPTVELDDVVNTICNEVGRLAFAFIAPLGSHNHNGRHLNPLLRPGQLAKSTDCHRLWPVLFSGRNKNGSYPEA